MEKNLNRALTMGILGVFISTIPFAGHLESQQTRTVFSNPMRLDLRKLGHPPLDVIPPGESAITSLVIGADGCLYGGTSGNRAHLEYHHPFDIPASNRAFVYAGVHIWRTGIDQTG